MRPKQGLHTTCWLNPWHVSLHMLKSQTHGLPTMCNTTLDRHCHYCLPLDLGIRGMLVLWAQIVMCPWLMPATPRKTNVASTAKLIPEVFESPGYTLIGGVPDVWLVSLLTRAFLGTGLTLPFLFPPLVFTSVSRLSCAHLQAGANNCKYELRHRLISNLCSHTCTHAHTHTHLDAM